MSVTSYEAHPHTQEEMYRLARRVHELEAQMKFLLWHGRLEDVAPFNEDHSKTYMVRVHLDPAAVDSHEKALAASVDGVPHAHEARKVTCEDGVWSVELHYLTAEEAADTRAHFEANGHGTSHHHKGYGHH